MTSEYEKSMAAITKALEAVKFYKNLGAETPSDERLIAWDTAHAKLRSAWEQSSGKLNEPKHSEVHRTVLSESRKELGERP